jgi:retinol dehydrogenase 14
VWAVFICSLAGSFVVGGVVLQMNGKHVFITGATSGIGKETARGLARMGFSLVFTTHDEKRGADALRDLRESTGNQDIEVLFCDLGSFASIRRCCAEYQERFPRLDVLINDAGVWDFRRQESGDGVERIFAINFLAPFLLTNLLVDDVKRSAPSRIVNVASGLHSGVIHFDDLEMKKGWSGMRAYRQSKLAVILFTRLLAKRLAGTGVSVNCVHPGLVKTNLARDAPWSYRVGFKMFGKSPEEGARTSIFVASSPDVKDVTGEYFADCKVARSSPESYDLVVAQRLWDVAAKWVGLEK